MPHRVEDLSVGAKIKFGAYSVSGEEPHKIAWIKVHHNNTLYNEFAEDILPFDAKEPLNPRVNRRNYGSNRYSVSNICGFINSEQEDWFKSNLKRIHLQQKNIYKMGTPATKVSRGFSIFPAVGIGANPDIKNRHKAEQCRCC